MLMKKSLADKKQATHDSDGYNFDAMDALSDLELLAGKLKSSVKGKDALVKLLKQLAKALEAAPQDVEALGVAKDSLPLQLLHHSVSENADKDVRLYGALCIMHVIRIYVPDLPYDDEQLKEVFELLLSCWAHLTDTSATGAFEICRAILRTFSDVKLFIPMLDLEDPDLLERTFRTLLQSARPENLQVLEASIMAVLTGILEEMDQPSQQLCDLVLSTLACPAAFAGTGVLRGKTGVSASASALATQSTSVAQRLTAQLLTSRDSALRGTVQRQVLSYVSKSLQDAVAGGGAGAGGGRTGKKAARVANKPVAESTPYDVFTLLHGLHASAPLLLLPVVPELKSQLRHEDENHRAAAAELVTRLMATAPPAQGPLQQASSRATGTLGLVTASPGLGTAASLATQFPDLLQELLSRFADQSPALRLQMLLRTGELVAVATAASPDGALERQVLSAARDRLHDFDDRVRGAACRGLCALAATAATGQAAPSTTGAPIVLYDNDMESVLHDVMARLRDRKITVRKDAASGLLVAWRGACTALQQGALSLPGLVRSVGCIPARLCTEAQRDLELRPHLMALLSAPPSPQQLLHHTHGGARGGAGRPGPGMMPASLGKQLGSAVWAALWASYGEADRTAVRKLLVLKAKAACELQQLVEVKRQLRVANSAAEASQPSSPDAGQRNQQRAQRLLMALCRGLARDVGGPSGASARASEQLRSLVDSAKDRFFWDRLGDLAALGSSPEALAAARKDALSRLPHGGSKSPVADLITRISHLAQPTLISTSHMAGLMTGLDAADTNYNNAVVTADLAVAVAKAAPGLCCAALPLVVSIVTANPPRPELLCTTAVRVLRHTVRHCSIMAAAKAGPARGSGSPDTPGAANGKKEEDETEEEDSGSGGASDSGDGDGGEGQEIYAVHAKKRARTAAATAGADSVDGTTRRSTRGLQRRQQQRNTKESEEATAVGNCEGGGVAGDGLQRTALVRALTALSHGPYVKAAKAAVHALRAVLEPKEGGRVAEKLATELMRQLQPGKEALAATPAVLQAMGSVGEVAPDVFAGHVGAFCKFIIQHYMLAPIKPSAQRQGGGRTAAAAAVPYLSGGSADMGWGPPSFSVACKIAAVRALARGCCPDADTLAATATAIPAATTAAVSSVVTELLVQLLSIENDMAEYGSVGDVDDAYLRITAARALLRLAKRHDSKLSASSYVALALTMQDPIMEVRQSLGDQMRLFLHSSLQLQRRSHIIAKYAAMLSLAGIDPRPENPEAAARTLREVVLLQKARAQEQALAAVTAARGAGGLAAATSRPSLSDLPEFMLAFLVYILAHHPDCPTVPERSHNEGDSCREPQEEEEVAAPELEDYRPFQNMLQFALEPLLAVPSQHVTGVVAGPAAASVAGVGEALPAVCKVLRSVKLQMQDGDVTVEAPATGTMRVLADIGIAVAKAIVERELLAAAASREGRQHQRGGGRATVRDKQQQQQQAQNPAAAVATTVADLARRDHPAQAVVPMRLFKLVDTAETRGLRADGSCLPTGYEVVLSPAIAEMGRRATTFQPPRHGDSTGATGTSGRAQAGDTPATAVRNGSGGGDDGVDRNRGTAGGSEADEAAAGAEEREDEEAEKGAVAVREGRNGSAKRKTGGAAAGGGGDDNGGGGGNSCRTRGKVPGAAAKRVPSPGGRGRGRGRTSASPRSGRGGRGAAAKRRRSGGYETLSEGEPSSSSEEEKEDGSEEEQGGALARDKRAVAKTKAKAAPLAGNPSGPPNEYELQEDEDEEEEGHCQGGGKQGSRRTPRRPTKRQPPLHQRKQQHVSDVFRGGKEGDEDQQKEQVEGVHADAEDDKENGATRRPPWGQVTKKGGGGGARKRGRAEGQGAGHAKGVRSEQLAATAAAAVPGGAAKAATTRPAREASGRVRQPDVKAVDQYDFSDGADDE